MKLEINNKKLQVNQIDKFWDRFKTLKFDLHPLKEVIFFPNKKYLSTYFFCQRVDVIMTDKDNHVLYLYKKIKTEKIIFYKRKVSNIYLLPPNNCTNIKVGDKLKIIENTKKEKKD